MFYTSLTITFTYAVIALTIEFLLGLGIALFLSKDMYGVGIMRIVVGIPILLVPAATTILWKALSSKTYGIFDLITSYLGLGSLGWWDDPVLSSILVILVDVWQWTPFVAIVLLAAILGLPKEPYEAAKVDGLSTYTVFTKITLPMLRPTIMIILILRFLDLLKLLEPVLLITKGSYPTLSMYVWRYVFKSLNIGFGGAFSTIYWLIAWILATILLRIFLKYRI
jgi:multiple sugar transport system permease protein